ncbi:PA3496 family putative envelope integrity protein [Thiorhodococcus minor]|uniref:Uncharacterized protein n=1 Tax=Thiorhodococcus minor TaxID=57489 RepID=A0A6M0JZH4_9GAMM|nr:hypothetical protein [Thiorhodococcus minor]NEV62890.1 hypothetical protein [Thiorhodococcus minor]
MLDSDISDSDEGGEPVPPPMSKALSEHKAFFEHKASPEQLGSFDVRRRIEHIRELRRLRELLEDPSFDELG